MAKELGRSLHGDWPLGADHKRPKCLIVRRHFFSFWDATEYDS